MNRVEYLLLKLQLNIPMDNDLRLCLKLIKDYKAEIQRLENEREQLTNKQGTNREIRENNNPEPKRSKVKGLREGIQGGSDRTSSEDTGNV
jgi:hypothetical protein